MEIPAYFGLLVVKDGEADVGDDDRLGQLVVPLPHRRRPARAHLERVVAEPQVVGGDHQHVLAVHLLGLVFQPFDQIGIYTPCLFVLLFRVFVKCLRLVLSICGKAVVAENLLLTVNLQCWKPDSGGNSADAASKYSHTLDMHNTKFVANKLQKPKEPEPVFSLEPR